MWRCLIFVIAATSWNLRVLAVPQGDNTCQGVVKHPVKVLVNVTEPVTFRTYTWCLRVPPRCSKYIVQMRERVKEQVEMHNRTITVCCRGYVEMESKCVPACPPMTECPNMHCNRTNHCYCSPGYSGTFCNDPCPKGSWGRDCKKPCDCPDGFTCHHLTGDCMMDDKPSVKTTARHSRFTHETVSDNSAYVTTLHPPTVKTEVFSKQITLMRTFPTLSTTLSTPFHSVTQNRLSIVPTSVKIDQTPSKEAPHSPAVVTTPVILTVPDKTTVTLKPTTAVFTKNPLHNEMRITVKTSVKPSLLTIPSNKSNKKGNSIASEAINETSEVLTGIVPVTSSDNILFKKSTKNQFHRPIKIDEDSNIKSSQSSHTLGSFTIAEKNSSVSLTTKSPENSSSPILFNLWNIQSKENKKLISQTAIRENTSIKPSLQDETLDFKYTPDNFKTTHYTTIVPIFLKTIKPLISSTTKHHGIYTTNIVSQRDNSITKSISTLIPVKTNPYSGASTNLYKKITFAPTERNLNEKDINVKLNSAVSNEAITIKVTNNLGPQDLIVSSQSPISKSTNRNYWIDKYISSNNKLESSSQSEKIFITSTALPSLLQIKNPKGRKTYSAVDTDKGIFVFPPRIPDKIQSYDTTVESSKEDFVLPTDKPFDKIVSYEPTIESSKGDFAFPTAKPFDKIPSYNPTIALSKEDFAFPTYKPFDHAVSTSKYILFEMANNNFGSKKQGSPSDLPFLIATTEAVPVEIVDRTKVTTSRFPTSSSYNYGQESKDVYSIGTKSESSLVSPSLIHRENKKYTTSPVDKLRTVIYSSKTDDRYRDSYRRKYTFSKYNSLPESTTKPTVEHSKIGTFLNVLNKNDFIAIFRPESEFKSGVRRYTVPNREYTNINNVINTTASSTLRNIEETTSKERFSNYITSTYSFTNKTDPSANDSTAAIVLPTIDILYNSITEVPETTTQTASEADEVQLDVQSSPPHSVKRENSTFNSKILEELSNFLPSINEKNNSMLKDKSVEKSQLMSNKLVTTESSRSGYLPTDKDFLNLTYILNSINDFNSNDKRAMKHSPKSVTYGNPPKLKLTEKPLFNDIITYTIFRHIPTSEMEKTAVTSSQKHFTSSDNRQTNSLNDSKIIHINVSSSHLSLHNPTTKMLSRKYPSKIITPSKPSSPYMRSKFIDGRITTVSIISTAPFTKFPVKRSTKETNYFKTENAFTRSHHSSPYTEIYGAIGETSTFSYDSVKKTDPESGEYSRQKSITEDMELTKKPFRRKELENTEGEVRPNMTAALSAHTSPADEGSTMSLATGILSSLICVLLLGSLTSYVILKYIYRKRNKPVQMESCIMAYDMSTQPTPIFSIPKLREFNYGQKKTSEMVN